MKKAFLILYLASCILDLANAQIIYVDASNTSGNEDGTESHPYNTIKEGINAASPGYQVLIKQGTYVPDDSWSGNDHTLFLKAGVNLVGEGADKTIIQGIVVDQENSSISISLEKLKFDEFHFIRATHAGPFNDRNIIRNCATTLIRPGFGAGIPVNDTTPGPNYGFQLENNDMGTEGIIEFVQGAGISEISVKGNTCGYIYIKSGGGYTYLIDNNDVQYGIFDKSATNKTTISDNVVHNGLIIDLSGGNQYGVEDEIIENNTITATENSPAFVDEDYKAGIIAKSRSVTIRNNAITCTGHVSGIRSSAGAPMHIVNNTITLDEIQAPDPDPYEGTSGIFNYSGWGSVTGNKIHGGNMGYYSKAGTTEFAGNEIEKSYTGFYSMGAEEVHHNIIKECKGDGMILDGLKGPLSYNMVINNAGAGIRVTRVPIDLGGGADASPGKNTLQGNASFDLYIETVNAEHPILFARNNIWDHENANDIAQLDIRDGSDSTGLVNVDFTPWAGLGLNDPEAATRVDIFPNPVVSHFAVRCSHFACPSADITIEILDIIGKVVADFKNPVDLTFDISHLPAGVYFCRVMMGNTPFTSKIIKL